VTSSSEGRDGCLLPSNQDGCSSVARIRTIKPELPQSESLGRVSRDARLLFINLWTIVDDSGRTRAASRLLASLLYPYDEDAATLIDGWLSELESIGAVRRYQAEGSSYLDIPNWLKHQKIDKPSNSRLPAFDDGVANPREPSRILAPDLGPRTMDLGPGRDHGPARESHDFGPPLIDGRAQRLHGQHAWCSWPKRDGLCVPNFIHDELAGKLGVLDARSQLQAWYPTVVAKYQGRTVGDKAPDFWRNEFASWVGTVTTAPSQQRGDKTTRTLTALQVVLANQDKAVG